MRLLPLLISFLAVASAAALSIRHQMPWPLTAYLVSQSLFALSGWWVLQIKTVRHREYLFFFVSYIAVLFFAVVITVGLSIVSFYAAILPLVTGAFLVAVKWRLHVHPKYEHQSWIAVAMIWCGILTLCALVDDYGPDLRPAIAACGAFWALSGSWGLAYAARNGAWEKQDVFVSPMLAIVCFGWLTWMWLGGQRELEREAIRGQAVAYAGVEWEP